jgi:hypothetical protein
MEELMKRLWITTFSVFIALLTLLPTYSNATELGEFCWRGVDSDDGDLHIERMQITQHGEYFSVNGQEVDEENEYETVSAFTGSGHIEGGILKLGLTGVSLHINDGIETEALWVEINLSDLTGTIKSPASDATTILTPIACP